MPDPYYGLGMCLTHAMGWAYAIARGRAHAESFQHRIASGMPSCSAAQYCVSVGYQLQPQTCPHLPPHTGPPRKVYADRCGDIQTDAHAVSASHRLGHAIMQCASILRVRRVSASAPNLQPHVQQNSQEFVAADSDVCCHPWRMARTKKWCVGPTSRCLVVHYLAASPRAPSENRLDCRHAAPAICMLAQSAPWPTAPSAALRSYAASVPAVCAEISALNVRAQRSQHPPLSVCAFRLCQASGVRASVLYPTTTAPCGPCSTAARCWPARGTHDACPQLCVRVSAVFGSSRQCDVPNDHGAVRAVQHRGTRRAPAAPGHVSCVPRAGQNFQRPRVCSVPAVPRCCFGMLQPGCGVWRRGTKSGLHRDCPEWRENGWGAQEWTWDGRTLKNSPKGPRKWTGETVQNI